MAPHQHLAWLEDNIVWFEQLGLADLTSMVPNCPGWSVEDVVNHLSFGLGLAYPVALSKDESIEAADAFEGVEWPSAYPKGRAALTAFSNNMRGCLATFRATLPESPGWTYEGPGVAKFWFRRAAIETAMHRMDVEEALHGIPGELAADRTVDAINEAVEFALPMAALLTAQPAGKLAISSPDVDLSVELGTGTRQATITGDAQRTLCALWGRVGDQVTIAGDQEIAAEWLSLIEQAFAG